MKRLQFRIIQLLVLSASLVIGAFGNTVSFDTSFNGTGYSINAATPPPQGSLGDAMAIQPDGKIVIGGITWGNAQDDIFAVMRLNADGTLDNSFGTGGSTTTGVGTDTEGVDLQLQPDGKILMCGTSYFQATDGDMTILRYTSGGMLDTTFNTTGFKTVNIGGASSSWDGCHSMVVLTDGKILIAGSTGTNAVTQRDVVLVRLNSDGSFDSTFNGTGIVTVANPSVSDAPTKMILLADGKLLVGGYRYDDVKYNYLLMRFNSDGTTDTSFGTGGTTITSVSSGSNLLTTMALQSDGKIVAGGSGFLVRYTANGILDTSFAFNGVANVFSSTLAETNELVVAGDDKIVIASKFGAAAGAVRYLANGFLDTSFNGGVANVHVPSGDCFTYSVAIQSDNKIVLGGYCDVNNTVLKFAVFRLQETRTKRFLDFNGDGLTDMSIFRPSNSQWWYSSNLSNQIFAGQWGLSTDLPVPADFTGDGRTDVAVFRPSSGEWFILRSDNGAFYSLAFGTAGDIPIAADYDGDDKADVGVFRPSTNEWYIQKSTGGLLAATFGTSGDKPVPADYDGDFKTDIAIYRPSTGEWWINRSSDGSIYGFQFGTSSDSPVQGDYTGDNKTDAAVYRPSTGEWFVLPSEGGSFFGLHFGTDGDLPTPGNYAGDSRFDFVVYRPSENKWYFQLAGGPFFVRLFGTAGDQPLPNLFVP